MATPRKLSGRFHARRRWRTRLALLAAAVLLVAGVAAFHVTRPHRLAAIAGKMLEDISGAQARIDSATITLGGRIDLRNVELRAADTDGPAGELFHAEQVLIAFNPWEALRGRFTPHQMILVRPVISLTELPQDAYNYERLVRPPAAGATAPDLPVLPRILVRDGRIRYGEVRDGRYRSLGEGVELTGRVQPDRAQPNLYRFELHGDHPAPAYASPHTPQALALTGEFDLQGLAVRAQMTGFTFTDRHRAMLPARIREWWDRFEPAGELRHIRFDYTPRDGFHGEVDIDGLALTLPPLTHSEYKPRMTDVTGTIRFDPDRITIHDLAGHIEGLRYHIDGRIDGYSAQAPFNLALRTKAFRIPEDPRYAAALPPDVQRVFTMLTPVGWTRVSMDLARQEPGGRIEYDGRAHILSGAEVLAELRDPIYRARHLPEAGPIGPDSPLLVSRGMYHQFPYELTNCRGLVTFNADAITVEHLTGDTPGGGRATITGTIGPPGPDPAIDLTITAADIPFDRTLYDALPPAPQRALGLFFHEESWRRLHHAGYFEPPPPAADALADGPWLAHRLHAAGFAGSGPRPAFSFAGFAPHHPRIASTVAQPIADTLFELGGSGDVLIKIQRPRGPNQHTTLHTAIDLTDTNILFEHFPYPIRVLEGRVIVSPTRIVFQDIRAAGLHGGTADLAGHIDLPANGSDTARIVPDLTLRAHNVPIDPLLLDVLPTHATDILARLHADGTIHADGRIFHNGRRDDIDIDLRIAVRNALARPGDGELTLDRIEGILRVSLYDLAIERLVGHRGEGRIELAGAADWADPDRPSIRLRARAENLRFEDHALGLLTPFADLPRTWTDAWDAHQPAGAFDANLRFAAVGDPAAPGPDSFRLDLRPRTVSFLHDGRRLALGPLTGGIVIEPGLIRLDNLTAQFDAPQAAPAPASATHLDPPTIDRPIPAAPPAGGLVSAEGTIHLEPAPRARLALRAAGSGVGPTLRQALPSRAAQLLRDADPQGRYQLEIPDFAYDADAPPGQRLAMNASFRLEDGGWRLGAPVADFHGHAALAISHDPEAGRPHAHVTLDAQRLRAAGRRIDDFHMTLHTTAGADHLVIPELSGRVGGGPLGGSGAISLTHGDFHLRIALADAQLAELAIAPTHAVTFTGDTDVDVDVDALPNPAAAPDPALHADDQPAGLLSASLALEGSWRQPEQVRGRGDILVREASLGGLPLVMGLVHISHLSLPIPDRFDRAALHYYIRDGRLVFETIQLDAPRLRVAGGGTVALRSAELDLTLTTANPTGLRLGPVTTLIDGVRNQLLTLHITGTADSPRVRLRQLNALNRAWNDVFQNGTDP